LAKYSNVIIAGYAVMQSRINCDVDCCFNSGNNGAIRPLTDVIKLQRYVMTQKITPATTKHAL